MVLSDLTGNMTDGQVQIPPCPDWLDAAPDHLSFLPVYSMGDQIYY